MAQCFPEESKLHHYVGRKNKVKRRKHINNIFLLGPSKVSGEKIRENRFTVICLQQSKKVATSLGIQFILPAPYD